MQRQQYPMNRAISQPFQKRGEIVTVNRTPQPNSLTSRGVGKGEFDVTAIFQDCKDLIENDPAARVFKSTRFRAIVRLVTAFGPAFFTVPSHLTKRDELTEIGRASCRE